MGFSDSSSENRVLFRTILLVVLLIAAIFLLAAAVYFALVFVIHALEARSSYSGRAESPIHWWNLSGFIFTGAITFLAISLGSLYKFLTLQNGMVEIVKTIGGRLADCDTLEEYILVKVVEEVALAAGIPMPNVVVLDNETGLNAFSLGDTHGDSFVGVTLGVLKVFSRRELQALVAFQVSKIIQGENVLNVRLMALTHGVVGISSFGLFLCAVGAGERQLFQKESADGVRTNPLAMFLGMALASAGFAGLMLGKIVKALVLRGQSFDSDREAARYLGDPEAMILALDRILNWRSKGALKASEGEMYSQFFFTDTNRYPLLSLISTHPSLKSRIGKLLPLTSGKMPTSPSFGQGKITALSESDSAFLKKVSMRKKETGIGKPISYERFTQHLRAPGVEALGLVRNLLASVPQELRRRVHFPETAELAAYCMLLSNVEAIRQQQIKEIAAQLTENHQKQMNELYRDIQDLPRQSRLLLADIIANTLRLLEPAEHGRFRGNIARVVATDGSISVFEFALRNVLLGGGPASASAAPGATDEVFAGNLDDAMLQVLACFALLTSVNQDVQQATQALRRALKRLDFSGSAKEVDFSQCNLNSLERYLDQIREAPLTARSAVVEGLAACVTADGAISMDEIELLRAVGNVVQLGIPPIQATE